VAASAAPSRVSTPGGRTLAQWYCLLGGAALLLAGLLGFAASTSFAVGDSLERDSLIGFDVNGIHNVVHLASGLVLLAAANTAPTARFTAIAFALVYGLVTLIGLIDGQDVFGLIPIDAADNVLHALLTILGLAAGVLSPTVKHKRGRGDGDPTDRTRDTATERRATETARGGGAGEDTGHAYPGQREASAVISDEEQRRRR